MSYHASITANTAELQSGLSSLRSSLAITNWMLRALGVPTEVRKAMMQMQRAIMMVRMLEMATRGGGLINIASMGLRAAGAGQLASGLKMVRKLSKLVG